MSNWLKKALEEACGAALAKIEVELETWKPYASRTEYGMDPSKVIDSTAIVIDDNVKALPQQKVGEA